MIFTKSPLRNIYRALHQSAVPINVNFLPEAVQRALNNHKLFTGYVQIAGRGFDAEMVQNLLNVANISTFSSRWVAKECLSAREN